MPRPSNIRVVSVTCRYAESKANSAAKELNTASINGKGAAPNCQIGLTLEALNYFPTYKDECGHF